MKKHLQYLRYVLRHKWFVFIECCKVGIPLRGLLHDWSKFRPCEWFPYVDYFYGGDWPKQPYIKADMGMTRLRVKCKADVENAFDVAWLEHQKRNPHHWQYWVLHEDSGVTKLLPMPVIYISELIADWKGCGRALGKPDTLAWYLSNRDNMTLHPATRGHIERLLKVPSNLRKGDEQEPLASYLL